MSIYSIPTCIGVFCLSQNIISFISGEKFSAATITSRILAVIIILIPFSTITNSQILIPQRKDKLVLISGLIGLVCNLISNLIFIPRYAENGAAIGTVVAEGAVAIFALYNASKTINAKELLIKNWKYVMASMPIFVIYRLVHTIVNVDFFILIITTIISVVTYFIILFFLKEEILIEEAVIIEKFLRERMMKRRNRGE